MAAAIGEDEAAAALARFGLEGAPVRITTGLVNLTWSVGRPPRYALQLLHPQFDAACNARAAAVAVALQAAGIGAPCAVAAPAGAIALPGPDGRLWRATRWVAGEGFARLPGPAHVAAAARLLARAHAALADWPGGWALPVADFHDTARRMAPLARLMGDADPAVARMAAALLAAWEDWRRDLPALEPRPAHGDPKASNILFRPGAAEATGLLDLDTVGRHGLDVELGDALRSWCARRLGGPGGYLDRTAFRAAVEGYFGAAAPLPRAERAAVVHGLGRVALELGARYCLDAVAGWEFAWDAGVAPDRRSHHLLRAEALLGLWREVAQGRGELEAIVSSA